MHPHEQQYNSSVYISTAGHIKPKSCAQAHALHSSSVLQVYIDSEENPGSLYSSCRAWVQNDPDVDPAQYPPVVSGLLLVAYRCWSIGAGPSVRCPSAQLSGRQSLIALLMLTWVELHRMLGLTGACSCAEWKVAHHTTADAP